MLIRTIPYHPWHQGAEFLWSNMKRLYRQKLTSKKLSYLSIDNKALIEVCIEEVSRETIIECY